MLRRKPEREQRNGLDRTLCVRMWSVCGSVFSVRVCCRFSEHFNLLFQFKQFTFILLHLEEWPCCVPLRLNEEMCVFFFSICFLCPLWGGVNTHTHTHTHTHTRVQTHTDNSAWQQTHAFCLGTVGAGNETKCGQAEGQVNERDTESLAVFDLPPLIQRDHLINWEDGMYIRIARGASLLFPIPNQITPQPPVRTPRGENVSLVCVCVCVCVRERKTEPGC